MPNTTFGKSPTRRVIEWQQGNPPNVASQSATGGLVPNLGRLAGTPRYVTYIDHDHQQVELPVAAPASAFTVFSTAPLQVSFDMPSTVPSYTFGPKDEGHYHVQIQTLDASAVTPLALVGWVITPLMQATVTPGFPAVLYQGSDVPNGVPIIAFQANVVLQFMTINNTSPTGNVTLLLEATLTDLFG